MTVTTLRPDSTSTNTGAVTGASAHAALADDSDATYVTFDPGEGFDLGVANLDEPTGARIKSLAIRARGQLPSGGFGALGLTAPVTITSSAFKSSISTFTIQPATAWASNPDTLKITGSALFTAVLRLHALYVDITYVEKPDLTVDGPTSTISDTNVPVIEWTPDLDSDGAAQTHYEVVILSDGEYADPSDYLTDNSGYSGIQAGSDTSWQPSEPLPDDTYRVYVRIAQTVNGVQHWSDWASSDFVIDVLLPAEPSIALVPEPSSGRMRLDIDSGAGGDATTDRYEVQASYDGGETFATIRTPEGFGLETPESDAAMLWDREGGNGQAVTYRVRALHDYSGLHAASAWTEATDMWGPTNDQWLKHPAYPSLDMKVTIHGYDGAERSARQGKFQPLSRSTVIVTGDKRAPWSGNLEMLTRSDEERAALDALLDANVGIPLLLQVGANDEEPDRWVMFGNHSRTRTVNKSWVASKIEALEWIEVARP